MIVIEDLKVGNMSKSAKGTSEQHGRNVRAKTGLNCSILDHGWYEMRCQLEYKQFWRGGQVLAIPPAYTSQQCACCGHTAKENRKTQSKFECQVCGYTENADINGARNILAAGHAVLACGGRGQSGRPLKQEPTGASQARPERCRSPCRFRAGRMPNPFSTLSYERELGHIREYEDQNVSGTTVPPGSMKGSVWLGPRSHRAV